MAAGVIDVGPNSPTAEDPIGRMARIVDGAIEAAVETGTIDGERVALYGHSFGGYAAIAIATRTNRYRAVVAANGPYDFYSSYGRIPPTAAVDEAGLQLAAPFGWFERGQGAMGAPPWQVAERYLAASAFQGAERIRSPVLLIHGDLDSVPVSEAERMFMALYRLGRDAQYLRYAGEGHIPASPANIRDQWERTRAFLAERLGMSASATNVAPRIRSSPRQ